jgi:hypothetical protein
MMLRSLVAAALFCLPATLGAQQETAIQLLDRGIVRMGGDSALRAIQSIRLDMLTQWFRTSFAAAPFNDLPSFERNVELRDYAHSAWRNSRYFSPTAANAGMVVVVRDTVAVRGNAAQGSPALAWAPLNVAYVEERRELFGFAPERLMLALRDDRSLRAIADSTIDGEVHARLQTTIDGWPTVVFVRRSDALPRMVRFRADETNDMGLAPWALHEVEFWYSNWGLVPPGVLLPRQRDVQRVGRPYKRMTLLQAVINPPAPVDSFAISDSLASAYFTSEVRPMWRVALDGVARIDRDHFATFSPFVGSVGAVRLGNQWVLLEAGQAMGATELIIDWLGRNGGGSQIGGAIAANVWTGNGGVPWFTSRRLPVFAAPGAMGTLRTVNKGAAGITVIDTPRWVTVGGDSLWLEPISAPDFSRTVAVYSPTHRWLWVVFAGSPVHKVEQEALIARLEARGLKVELIGGARVVATPRTP